MDMKEFLYQYSVERLRKLGILHYDRNELNGKSFEPIIKEMKQRGINRLEHGEWYLDKSGNFRNPKLSKTKEGNAYKLFEEGRLRRYGDVFKDQNVRINPYYKNPHK
ncbi:hypothetical protein BHF71_05955 [Vulcanibacillus modesticaldus]|uniref:Uncharacterized protein n=1 Tax=Vulcanibacillus modesticaldus TaxID=337097 RepID=A0A1D2YWL2_9BACI|nr:hypothetical protein [Vulcanibacillus modesticaldus]OEG00145.1 hypothetical protein BHF71_05955 [Vulcanibacillus modesticaldus]